MNTAFVTLWGARIGAVLWDPASAVASFEYDPDFIVNGREVAPLTMPLQAGAIYQFPEHAQSSTFKGLPGLLADTLPDRYGNALINEWLARQGRPPGSMHPVEMLSFIGNRGMGALEFQPVIPKGADKATSLEIPGLIEIAHAILNERSSFTASLTSRKEKELLDILKIGTSAGGARAKALIAYNERTGEVRSGQAGTPAGFQQWLIKFDGVHDSQFGASYGYGNVEMAYYEMATKAGIHMMESRLFEENGRSHFMTRRFDRPDNNRKLHVQTWCALTHRDFQDINSFSYEELFQTMRILRLPYQAAEQLFKRMVFNVVARNCDDHTKNFAFTMDNTGQWSLAPAYDICHAYRPESEWVSRHCLSINGKRSGISTEDVHALAKEMNIKKPDNLIKEVVDVVNSWETIAVKNGVREDLLRAIRATFVQL